MNDDILAIYSKPLQEQDFVEWQKVVIKKRTKTAFMIVVVGTVIIFIAAILEKVMKINIVSTSTIVVIAVCFLASVFFRYIFPNLFGKLRYKQYYATHNEKGQIAFYADYLEILVGEEIVKKLHYADIKRATASDNLYILEFPPFVYCIVRRDGFISGSLEDVQKQIDKVRVK